MTTDFDLEYTHAEAATNVFERTDRESLPREVRERAELSAEFNRILDHARSTLLDWSEKSSAET